MKRFKALLATLAVLAITGTINAHSSTYTASPTVNNGSLAVSDFLMEVAKGNVPGHTQINKYGHNPAITTSTDPEDVWGGAGVYAFYFTANQTVEAVSTDVDDVGLLRDSGTATGGSLTTLEDSGADFAPDGVTVGDIVINDTTGQWGTINIVNSSTLVTHTPMTNASSVSPVSTPNKAGDTYRIASSSDTGAGVIHIEGLTASGLDWVVATETVILNGQTDVAINTGFVRMYRAFVLNAGSSASNEGTLSVEVDTTTNAGLIISPMDGQTQQAIFTIPSGMTGFFIKGYVGISSGGNPASPASAIFTWRARINNGTTGVFAVKGQIEIIANGGQYWIYEYGIPVPVPEKSDIIIRCDEVSADVGVIGAFDMMLVENEYLNKGR